MKPSPPTTRTTRIEQAIARGLTFGQIAEEVRCPIDVVVKVWQRMEQVVTEEDMQVARG